MKPLDLSTLGGLISAVWRLIGGVMRLDPDAFRAALMAPDGWLPALIILILGALSDGIGHSVVLFANRVRPRRFAISLLLNSAVQTLIALAWAGAIWLTVWIVDGVSSPLDRLFTVLALSFAPQVLGVFVLLPYLGLGIHHLLRVWVTLALLVGVGIAYKATFWQALPPVLLGWALFEGVTRIPFLRIKQLDNWLWRLSTGTQTEAGISDLAAGFVGQRRRRDGRKEGQDGVDR